MNRQTYTISHNRLNRYMIKTYQSQTLSKIRKTHNKRNSIKRGVV